MVVTPVPIPNTKVKNQSADGTAGAALWESRSLPGREVNVLIMEHSLFYSKRKLSS